MSVLGRKSGKLTEAEIEKYDSIKSQINKQKETYDKYIENLDNKEKVNYVNLMRQYGFNLNLKSGRISYLDDFKPIHLKLELCYVRHGKTEGNTEPRIFQGNVDYEENQLNEIGLQQAIDAADRMDQEIKKGWRPDLIIYSPLMRAKETGDAFHDHHQDIPCHIIRETAEMAFGDWDNIRVIDVPHDSIAHLFYLEQNVLVKSSNPHIVKKGALHLQTEGEIISAECFIDVIDRMAKALKLIDDLDEVKAIKDRRPKVLMYGHSMVGAAVSMLLGHGKTIENSNDLGFDGKYIMPNATPTYLLAKQPL